MKSRQGILIAVLILLLIAALAYIAYDSYTDYRQKQEAEILNNGIKLGYENAVSQVIAQASSCKVFQVYYNTTKVELINVQCLQQNDEDQAN